MSDLIDRQAAIDAMRKAKDKSEAHRMLIQLPSATDTNVGGNLSVDELIEFLNPESNYVFYDDAHGFCINTQDVLDHLCAMPPAQPGWIPCSGRLPKPNEYENGVRKHYLIQNEYGDMMVCSWDGCFWTQMYRITHVADKVVAWMPLPESWEGGQS